MAPNIFVCIIKELNKMETEKIDKRFYAACAAMQGLLSTEDGINFQAIIQDDFYQKILVDASLIIADELIKRCSTETNRIDISSTINNHQLHIEPYFDENAISTAVTTFKVVDNNGVIHYTGTRKGCEYFIQNYQ